MEDFSDELETSNDAASIVLIFNDSEITGKYVDRILDLFHDKLNNGTLIFVDEDELITQEMIDTKKFIVNRHVYTDHEILYNRIDYLNSKFFKENKLSVWTFVYNLSLTPPSSQLACRPVIEYNPFEDVPGLQKRPAFLMDIDEFFRQSVDKQEEDIKENLFPEGKKDTVDIFINLIKETFSMF